MGRIKRNNSERNRSSFHGFREIGRRSTDSLLIWSAAMLLIGMVGHERADCHSADAVLLDDASSDACAQSYW
jgi:hypothetical protein